MFLVLYDKNETNFNTLGLGVLRDLKTEPEITEVLNGLYNLEFTYINNGWLSEYLIEGNIVKAKGQPFRIRSIKKNIKDKSITILAKHIFFDLEINNYLEDVSPSNKKGHEALEWILTRTATENNFKVSGDCTKVASARYVRVNPINAIYTSDNCILNRFGGELEIDNYNIILHNKRGLDLGIDIRQDKNLQGAEYEVDISSVITRVMPIGKDGLLLPEKYIDSPLIDSYYAPFYYKYELDIGVDEENGITLDECYNQMRESVQELFNSGADKPKVSLSIDFVELSKTKEYEKYSNLETAHLGDTCRIFIPDLNLNLSARVVKIIYNCSKERITKLELGTIKPNYVNNNKTTVDSLKNSLEKVNPTSILSQAKKDATELLKHPFNGYIHISEETGEMYIMDTNDINTANQLWKFGLGGIGHSSTGINGIYETAITQDGQIVADFITTGKLNTSVIEGYDDLVLKVNDFSSQAETIAKIEMDLEKINSEIGSITDTTVSASGTGTLILDNVLTSELLYLQVYPTYTDLSYLYPADDLFPSDDLFLLSRDIVFTSEENEVIFTLPCDLLFIDSTIRDELIINYDTQEMYVIHRVGLDENGNKYALSEATTEYFDYSGIILPDGDYSVSMPSFEDAYIYVRSLAKNLYTAQYATKVELNSAITSTTTSINARVDEKITLVNGELDELSAQLDIQADAIALKLDSNKFTSASVIGLINNRDGTSTAQIKANNIDLSGTNFNLTSQNITISSNNFSVDIYGNATMNNANVNGTIKSSNGTIGGWNINSSGLNNGNVFINSNGYSSIYTIADYFIIKNYLLDKEGFEFGSVEISHYDLNGDGQVNSADLLAIRKMTLGY